MRSFNPGAPRSRDDAARDARHDASVAMRLSSNARCIATSFDAVAIWR